MTDIYQNVSTYIYIYVYRAIDKSMNDEYLKQINGLIEQPTKG